MIVLFFFVWFSSKLFRVVCMICCLFCLSVLCLFSLDRRFFGLSVINYVGVFQFVVCKYVGFCKSCWLFANDSFVCLLCWCLFFVSNACVFGGCRRFFRRFCLSVSHFLVFAFFFFCLFNKSKILTFHK